MSSLIKELEHLSDKDIAEIVFLKLSSIKLEHLSDKDIAEIVFLKLSSIKLEHLSDKDISEIEIQTGQAIIYKMNES